MATNRFATQFASASLNSLVESFNRQVGSRAWSFARALHDRALIAELVSRGVDVSAVHDDTHTSFAHHVRLDGSRLVLTD